ncbi:hypothetical protein DID88_001154 [Monilinia fructigena]|uniref:Uncharacterized protein n=1 Tax=Monilinia fructigena TaxID=38457 RepID=A0A395IXN9_9HELO|nr:hypothetical protein DID88_001154 [Monilinia fructigena]
MNEGAEVEVAQREWVGCSLEESNPKSRRCLRSRRSTKEELVLDFESWWDKEIMGKLGVLRFHSNMAFESRL